MERLRAALTRLRPALAVALLVACAGAGGYVGLRLTTPVEHETAIGRVQVSVRPASRGTIDAFVPLADWGVRAYPFSAPIRLRIEPRTLDRDALLRATSGDRDLLQTAEDDASEAGEHALRRYALGVLLGALLGGVLWSLGWAAATGGRRGVARKSAGGEGGAGPSGADASEAAAPSGTAKPTESGEAAASGKTAVDDASPRHVRARVSARLRDALAPAGRGAAPLRRALAPARRIVPALRRALLPLRRGGAFARRHRRGLALTSGPLGALAIAGVAIVAVALRVDATFDSTALRSPEFYARGAELPQLLQVAAEADESAAGYGSQVERTVAGYAELLSNGLEFRGNADTRRALVVSDLHNNLFALDPLERLAVRQRVFFPGDFGQDGGATERRVLPERIARLGTGVVAVSGNHDSELLMRALARAGVVVLTEQGRLGADGRPHGPPVIEIDGMAVAGARDPLEWRGRRANDPRRVYSFGQRPEGRREYAAARDELIRWFRALPRRPQIVLVHQNGLAQDLARALAADGADQPPLTVVTGHDHKQHVDRHGPITVVDGGTVGAGGVFGASTQSLGLAALHFADGDERPLRAVDLIRFEPFGGSADARRIPVDEGEK